MHFEVPEEVSLNFLHLVTAIKLVTTNKPLHNMTSLGVSCVTPLDQINRR